MARQPLHVDFSGAATSSSLGASRGAEHDVSGLINPLNLAGIEGRLDGDPLGVQVPVQARTRGADGMQDVAELPIIGEALDHDGLQFLVVRYDDGAYRFLLPEGGQPKTGDNATYLLANPPGGPGERGLLAKAVTFVVQRVVAPYAKDIAAGASGMIVRQWEHRSRPHGVRRYHPDTYRNADAAHIDPSDLASGRSLLLIHGTNSLSHSVSGIGGMSRELIDLLWDVYGGRIIAFDHPTLATTPQENAEWLRTWLNDCAGSHELDIVCHSRGGLVARLLAEPNRFGSELATDVAIRSVNFIATPNQGTPLADPAHLGAMFDRLTSMIPFGLAGPAGDVAEGTLTAIRTIAEGAYEGLVGVTSMQPGSELLEGLNTPESAPAHTSYRAIATDYEPEPGSGLWNSIKDHGVDTVFEGRPNDVVIPTLSGLQLSGELGEGFTDMVVFSEHDGIRHSSIFGSRLGTDVLAAWVRPTPDPLPASVQDRRHTKAEIESIEAVGAEWGLGLLEDLTCFAPKSSQSALQLAIDKAGAALWPFIPRRDGAAATPIAIIVPGIMGSSLSADGEPVWISPWRLVGGGLRKLRLAKPPRSGAERPEVTADQVLCFAYRRLAEKLSDAGYQVIGQPYDWRLDLEPAARRLNETLRGLLESNAAEVVDAPIHIVAHSMGGLVTRWAQHLDPDLFERLTERGEVVFLGTPSRGSFAAPLALSGEYPPIKMLAALDLRASKTDVIEIVSDFAGMTQLLPSPTVLPDDIREHLYNADNWATHGELTANNLKLALGQHAVMEGLDNTHLHIVLGDGVETPVAVRITTEGELQFQLAPSGDGTVSVECGTIDQVRSLYFAHGTGHGDLVKDPKALQGVVDLLGTGSTKQFLSSRMSRGAGAQATSGPFVSAAETGDRLSTTPTTRGGRRDGLPSSRLAAQQMVTDGLGGLLPTAAADGPGIVHVEIVHADLEAADHPVMLGHATGTPLSGAENRVNQLLDGELTRLQAVGLLPDRPDDFRWVPRTNDYQQLAGAVVVALDSRQPLTPPAVTAIVRAATIDFVDRISDSVQMSAVSRTAPLGLSAVAIGTGPVFGLAPERAVLAIVKGVIEANEVLTAATSRTIERLQFVERYATKAERLHWTLRRVAHDAEESVGRLQIDVPRTVSTKDGALPGSPSPRYDSGRWERLIVRPDRETTGHGPLQITYQYATNRAAVSDESRRVDRSVVAQRIRTAVADPATAKDQGIALYEDLLPFELKEELSQSDNLVLLVDARTADIPWEMLVDKNRSGQPLATSMGLLRQFSDEGLRPATQWHHDRGALVIGDPPTDLPPLPGAREEAKDVAGILADAGITPKTILGPDVDRGRSAADIKQELNAHAYQIVHIASHGLYDLTEGDGSSGPGGPEIIGGVAVGPNAFLTADDFKNLRVPPDLVFLNCCHLGRIKPVVEHQPLGSDQGNAAASIARQLMRIGVKAVVVAGWAVNDAIAHAFARRLYGNLALRGLELGAAVREAREGALVSSSIDNTWAAYQVYGDPEFRLRDAHRRPTPSTSLQLPLASVAERRVAEISSAIRELEADTPIDDVCGQLDDLDQAIETTWPSDGMLLARRGRAWSDLGEFPRAIALYERATAMSDGNAPTWVTDQHFNLLSRYAAALHRGETFAFPPSERPTPSSLMRRARRNQVVLERLGLNAERHALIGGLQKREGAIGATSSTSAHCIKAAEAYLKALEAKPNSYHLCNYLQLAAIASLCDPDSADHWRVEASWLSSLHDAAQSDPSAGEYWTRIGVGDANLTIAVLAAAESLVTAMHATLEDAHEIWGRLDDPPEWDDVADIYLAIRRAGGRRREQLSTIGHINDLAALAPEGGDLQRDLSRLAAGLRSPTRSRGITGTT